MNNYPDGAANDPRAPYNWEDAPEQEFELEVTSSLSRQAVVTSNEYEGGYRDEEGYYEPAILLADKKQLFKESCYSVTELLGEFVKVIDEKISIKTQAYENLKESASDSKFCKEISDKFAYEIKFYKHLKEEALAWTDNDDEEIDI